MFTQPKTKTHLVSSGTIDIYELPRLDSVTPHPEGSVVTIGDLHANVLKLCHYLTLAGVIHLSDENYRKMIDAYRQCDTKATEGREEAEVIGVIAELEIKPAAPKLRFIGDELADRGNNDLFMIATLSLLHDAGVNFESLVSNHFWEFLRQFAFGLDVPEEELKILYQDKNGPGYSFFGRSFHGLRKMFAMSVVPLQEIETIIEINYLPHIKLLSYSIDGPDKITLYTHAPANLASIKKLAGAFGVPFSADTMEGLTKSIDHINEVFQKWLVDKNSVKRLFEFFERNPRTEHTVLAFFSDRYESLDNEGFDDKVNYTVTNVHGHVGEMVKAPLVGGWIFHNIDTDVGKSPSLSQGTHLVYVLQENSFRLEETKKFNPI